MTATSRSPAPVPCPQQSAGHARQSGGEEGEGRGAAAAGEVGADAGLRHPARCAALGGAHAGDRTLVGLGAGDVAGGGEADPYRLDECFAHRLDGAVGGHGCGGDGERGHLLVSGDLRDARAHDQGVARRDAADPCVRGGVLEGFGDVGGGEECGEVADVEVGLDEVRERECGGGEGGAARPRGVEDGAGAREVADDHGAAADLDDRRVAARPRGEVAERTTFRGVERGAQLGVGGGAGAEDGDTGLGVGAYGAEFVGTPVADRPQRVRVAPRGVGPRRAGWCPRRSRRRWRGPWRRRCRGRGPGRGCGRGRARRRRLGCRTGRSRRGRRSRARVPRCRRRCRGLRRNRWAGPVVRTPQGRVSGAGPRCCSTPPTSASSPPQAVDNPVAQGSSAGKSRRFRPCCHEEALLRGVLVARRGLPVRAGQG